MIKVYLAFTMLTLQAHAFEDSDYSIVNNDKSHPQKCVIDVRLKKEVEIGELKSIAFDIRPNCDSGKYVFIRYFIPDQPISDGPWAYSNFNPELDAKINGYTKKQIQKATKPVPGVIGKWVDNSSEGAIYVLTKNEKGLRMTSTFKDGSKVVDNLIEIRTGNIVRYKIKNNRFGEYYMIFKDQLFLYEKDGAEGLVADKVK